MVVVSTLKEYPAEPLLHSLRNRFLESSVSSDSETLVGVPARNRFITTLLYHIPTRDIRPRI